MTAPSSGSQVTVPWRFSWARRSCAATAVVVVVVAGWLPAGSSRPAWGRATVHQAAPAASIPAAASAAARRPRRRPRAPRPPASEDGPWPSPDGAVAGGAWYGSPLVLSGALTAAPRWTAPRRRGWPGGDRRPARPP